MATAPDIDAPANPLDAFRAEARAWIAANFPPALKGKDNAMSAIEGPHENSPEEAAWQQAMGDKGWGVPIAVAGPRWVGQFPGLATLAEQGYDSFLTRSPLWQGLIGPRGLDAALVQRLANEVKAAMETDSFIQALAAMSHVPDYKGPEEFRASVGREYDAVATLMKTLGVQPV